MSPMHTEETGGFDRLIPVASIVLGAGSRVVDSAGQRWIGNVAALWFLVAFLMGRRQPSPTKGASAGIISLFIATVVYYAWRLGIDGDLSNRYFRTVGAFWLLAAIGVGALAGWAGWRSRGMTVYWGAASGTFLGEAAAVALLSQRTVQVAIEIVVGALLLRKGRPQTAGAARLAIATGVVVLVAAGIYRVVLR